MDHKRRNNWRDREDDRSNPIHHNTVTNLTDIEESKDQLMANQSKFEGFIFLKYFKNLYNFISIFFSF